MRCKGAGRHWLSLASPRNTAPHLDVLPRCTHGQALDQYAEAGLAGAEARGWRATKAAAAAAATAPAPHAALGQLHTQAVAVKVVAVAPTHCVLGIAAGWSGGWQ